MLDLYRMSATPNPRTILRKEEVLRRTGLKTTRLYELISKEEFPAQVSIGARAVGWYEDEVQDWIRERPGVESRRRQSAEGTRDARPDSRAEQAPRNGKNKDPAARRESAREDSPDQTPERKPARRPTSDAGGGKSATEPSDASGLEDLKRMSVENSKLKVMLANLMLENEALRSALADKSAA